MKFINKFVNLPKLVRTVWIMLWAILLGLSAIKILFNKWYPIAVDNVYFVNVCDFIDGNIVLKHGIMLLFYLLSANLTYLTSTKRMKYKNIWEGILLNGLALLSYLMKTIGNGFGVLIECTYLIFIPLFINYKRKPFYKMWLNLLFPIFVYLALNIWQLNMLFIKDIEIILNNAPTLLALIIQLDYYIFLIITWIGVNYFMGLWSVGWFFGKSETELLAIKKEELAKEKPDMKLVEDIDKELKRREEEK